MRLDNMQLKNVVVQNTDVIYEGGPIILENVHFLNCNFEIKRAPNSEELTAYLLEPGPITFSREVVPTGIRSPSPNLLLTKPKRRNLSKCPPA